MTGDARLRIEATGLPGVYTIDPQPNHDERGFFARVWCRRELEARGLRANVVQCSVSYNATAGTLRGLHFQAAPHGEVKLVRCTMGAIFDVLVDVRPGSPTYRNWLALELTAANRRTVYVPEGVAHGFLTLVDDVEVFYQMSEFHNPEADRGVRWDDPAIGVEWPMEPRIMSARDRSYPDLTPR